VLGYAPDDIVYVQLPLSFDYGLYQLFLAAASGAQVWLAGPADGGPALLRSLRRSAATVLPAVPPMADGLVRMLRRSQTQQLALRMFTSTGAAILPETVRSLRSAVPGLRIHLMFGLTECKRATIMPADGDLDRPGSCGRALPGTEVFIIGDGGRRLPAGEVGEIVVRGANVMSGYWRRPGDSRRVFPCAEGLFPELRTGDYGWLDEAGYLYFAGRRDDIYKEKGYRVSAAEVETGAPRVPGVLDAAVVPADGQSGAVLAVTGPLSAAEVLHGMTSQIEDFKIPRNCLRVNELPRNCNGKVDRKAIMLLARQAGNA
jgi:acyl-CoA synthetase (AMP-forming)/AMP-acid ligase II